MASAEVLEAAKDVPKWRETRTAHQKIVRALFVWENILLKLIGKKVRRKSGAVCSQNGMGGGGAAFSQIKSTYR
jgi:hypothetical protein